MSQKLEKPSAIEKQFRKELGEINPYFCLVDAAVENLINNSTNESDKASYLRKVLGQSGHHRLYTEHLDFDSLRKLAHLSHIAFINSKADAFCKRVQNIKTMLNASKGIVKGDFLRKTIAVVHSSKEGDQSAAKDVKEEIYVEYIGEIELQIIDYFRLTRNNASHESGDSNIDTIRTQFDLINQDLAKERYKLRLNAPKDLDSKDVLLFSKVWQAVAKQICRKCVNIERDVYSHLQSHYQGISDEKRRMNKIRKVLQLDYLQNDEDISRIINKVG